MKVGIESLLGTAAEVEYEEDMATVDALSFVEALVALNEDEASLTEAISFLDNAEDIIASVKVNGIDAGTEALVGKELVGAGIAFDATDVEGACASLEAAKETVWARVKETAKAIFEKIKDFFKTVFLNYGRLLRLITVHTQRIAKIDKPAWKKAGKSIKVLDINEVLAAVKGAQDVITSIVEQVGDKEFSIAQSADADAVINGTVASAIRAAGKRSVTITTDDNNVGSTMDSVKKAMGAATDFYKEVKAMNATISRVKVKLMDEGDKNAYAPTKCVRAVSSIASASGVVLLRSMAAAVKVMRNVK